MNLLPSYKDIAELLKKGLTIEAQEKIMELREGALALQEENLSLKKSVIELELELNKRKKLNHVRQLYYAEGDAVPFCPRCWENDDKLIHLFGPVKLLYDTHVGCFQCMTCHYDYSAKEGKDFSPEKNMHRARRGA